MDSEGIYTVFSEDFDEPKKKSKKKGKKSIKSKKLDKAFNAFFKKDKKDKWKKSKKNSKKNSKAFHKKEAAKLKYWMVKQTTKTTLDTASYGAKRFFDYKMPLGDK
jgi:hypothetical protein